MDGDIMSKCFYVTNKNSARVLSLEECLKLFENLSIYNIDEEVDMSLPITNFECITLGKDDISARGFELSYIKKDGCYEFRILSPSSSYDWQILLLSINILADFLGVSEIKDEDNQSYSIDEILNYNYKNDILGGIECLKKYVKENHRLVLPCLTQSIHIDEELLNDILLDNDIVNSFSEFITKIENLDAYFATQRFYNQDNRIIGVYTLTEGVRTVLPLEPEIEFSYQDIISKDDFEGFKLAIVVCNGDSNNEDSYEMIDIINYDKLFSHLDNSKYKRLDAYNFVINPLTKDELITLITED